MNNVLLFIAIIMALRLVVKAVSIKATHDNELARDEARLMLTEAEASRHRSEVTPPDHEHTAHTQVHSHGHHVASICRCGEQLTMPGWNDDTPDLPQLSPTRDDHIHTTAPNTVRNVSQFPKGVVPARATVDPEAEQSPESSQIRPCDHGTDGWCSECEQDHRVLQDHTKAMAEPNITRRHTAKISKGHDEIHEGRKSECDSVYCRAQTLNAEVLKANSIPASHINTCPGGAAYTYDEAKRHAILTGSDRYTKCGAHFHEYAAETYEVHSHGSLDPIHTFDSLTTNPVPQETKPDAFWPRRMF